MFKTVSDPFVGHITMFRVFSGAIRPDTRVHNTTQGTDERIGQLFTLRGKEHESVPEVSAGDIGAVAKLQHAHTGDTFSAPRTRPCTCRRSSLPEPLLAYAIAPKTKGEEDKLATGLSRLREEDPTLRVSRSEETHRDGDARHGRGASRGHDRAAQAKVRGRRRHQPGEDRLSGRRSAARRRATGRHVKQSGGHGQYAVCMIDIEPLAHGEGFVYESKIFGGAIPQQFIPSIEKGIVKTMAEGVVSGNPMVDVKVTLVDGKFHTVDSSDMAFQIAGSMALKEAVEQAGVALLEPVVDLEVVVPEAYTGDVMGDLNAKRGKIAGMEQIGGGKQRIKAQVPQAEVARYVIDLRSMTGGRGAFSMTFSHYEQLPQHLAQKVIDELRRRARKRTALRQRAALRLEPSVRSAVSARKGSTAASNASGLRRLMT